MIAKFLIGAFCFVIVAFLCIISICAVLTVEERNRERREALKEWERRLP